MRNDSFTISKEEFARLTDYIWRKTGIFYDESKRYYVEKRVFERMRLVGRGEFREYFHFLRSDSSESEFQALVNLLTVNETYFFREYDQLKCFAEEVLPELLFGARAEARKIRIWSAGCSTGEEAYTLAIILQEMLDSESCEFEVHATDINTDALQKARRGVYEERAVREMPLPYLEKYLTWRGGSYHVFPDLKKKVRFYQLNLRDRARMREMQGFDAIFCRNVLIYFDERSRREVALLFYESLRPGGFIFLGHSESMSRISPIFRIRKFKNAIIYQK